MCCVHSPWSNLFKSGTICCGIFLTLSVQKTGGWCGNIWTLNLYCSISSPHFCYSNWSGHRPVIWSPSTAHIPLLCVSLSLHLSVSLLAHFSPLWWKGCGNRATQFTAAETEGWWARANSGWWASIFFSFYSPWASSLWARVSYIQPRSFLFV